MISFLVIAFDDYAGGGVSDQDEFWNSIKGSPRIIHYTRKDFNGDPQFWTMCEGTDGVLYFGNNDGALIFDGERWRKILLPNNSSVRSLQLSNDGTIYAAGFNEFGKIVKDSFGEYQYQSLVNLLRPEDRDLENVWQIHEVQGHIVFRTFKKLIALNGEKAVTLPAANYFDHAAVINDVYYVLDGEGIKSLDLQSFEFTLVIEKEKLLGQELCSLLPGADSVTLFALTKQGSLFSVSPNDRRIVLSQRLIPDNSRNLVTCGIRSSEGKYYVGTLSNQVIVLNQQGEQLVNHPIRNLQDNTVLNLYQTQRGNIWAMLNNGIDCIDMTSPVSLVLENASIFDVIRQGDRLYVATNQGVFVSGTNREGGASTFEKITGLEGQAWSLQEYKGQILCAHDRGLFILDGNAFRKNQSVTGIWKVIPVKGRDNRYLVCTYEGLYVLDYTKDNGFVIRDKVEGFNESTRDILESDTPGIFWVCHGYKGVFRIKIDDAMRRVISVEHFKDQNGLPSPFNINVFRWQNEIAFTTNHGIYTYNESNNQFEVHSFLTGLLGRNLNVRKLQEFGDKTWFIHDDEAGYFKTSEPTPSLEKGLFLQLKGTFNRGMECIVPVDDLHVLVGTNTGLYYYDLGYDYTGQQVRAVFTGISSRENDEVTGYALESSPEGRQSFPNKASGIRFDFAAPLFPDKLNTQYSYWLEGAEKIWGEWQDSPFKEYSNLRPGKYAFHVRARSLLGEQAEESVYFFSVMPVWYQTTWAIVLFVFTAIFVLLISAVLVRRKIEKVRLKTLAEEKEKRKVLELELERIKLEREKEAIKKDKDQLEEDIIYKSKELANYTMLLIKKRELLAEIQEGLKDLRENVKNENSRQKMRDLVRKINVNLENEEHLQIFEANFERVHHEFFNELKGAYPDLSQKELRLCAFVRMNLTNKEIASILNISVRGVETARYRLRKRLSLTHKDDMAGFLEKLHSSTSESVESEEESLS